MHALDGRYKPVCMVKEPPSTQGALQVQRPTVPYQPSGCTLMEGRFARTVCDEQ